MITNEAWEPEMDFETYKRKTKTKHTTLVQIGSELIGCIASLLAS